MFLGLLLNLSITIYAQEDTYEDPSIGFGLNAMDSASVLKIPFGYTRIGDQQFIGFRVQPEISIWKIGVGLDIPFLFNLDSLQDGKFQLREDEYTGGVGLLRMFRYIRYGFKKRDKVYAKIGDMTGEYIGFGGLVNNYSNAPNFEKRKVGLSLDVRPVPYAGLEGIYSDFSTTSMLALRPYTRPFATTEIPIVETIEAGLIIVTDNDRSSDSTAFVRSGMNAWGVDIGATIINTSFLQLVGYMQYSRLRQVDTDTLRSALAAEALLNPNKADLISNYKSAGGFSIGANVKLNLIANIFNLDARLERLWYGNYYRPQFFNAVYEINKDRAILNLASTERITGTYGVLTGTLLNKLRISGGLLFPDNISAEKPALIHLGADASEIIPKWILTANYIKGDLANLGEAFILDERSLLTARMAYRVASIFAVGVDYRWTFARIAEEDGTENVEATNYVMPYFGLYVPLNLNIN